MHGTVGTGKHDHLSKTSPPCNIYGNQIVMASVLLGKKTLPLDMIPSIPPKMTGPGSNELIVVRVAIVESPAVNRLTVLFRMRNKKKGGAGHNDQLQAGSHV